MRDTWTFHTAGQFLFGRDAVRQLGDVARPARAPGASSSSPIRSCVKAGLHRRGPRAARRQRASPSRSSPAASRSRRCGRPTRASPWRAQFKPDALLGLGGGSNMDLAKITAVVLAHGGSPRDYVGDDKIPGPIYAAHLRADHRRHRLGGVGRLRAHRHRQPDQGRHPEQLPAAARGRWSIRC